MNGGHATAWAEWLRPLFRGQLWGAALLASATPLQTAPAPALPPPAFSVPAGAYTNTLTLELNGGGPGIALRFTLDGSEPQTNSTTYSDPITLTNSALVRVKAFGPEARSSPVVSACYTLLGPDLVPFSSNLPLVIINLFGQYLSHETKVPASVRFIRPENGRSRVTGPADFDGRAQINIRGYSSLQFPKHSYTLKTQGDDGHSRPVAVLGFPADSDWVLYAPYTDKTLMRDVLAYELSNRMGHYAPRTRFVEVFITRSSGLLGKKHYAGVYVLEEKIKRSKDRVNIAELRPQDNSEPNITGGYIFKKDHRDKPEPGFVTSKGIDFFYVEPKPETMTPQQKQWLGGYLDSFEKALSGRSFKDPKQGYAAYIDADSFIDYHWIVEMSKNIDGYRLSNYLQKDRVGKLKMEPIWDWNLSFGNANYMNGWEKEGWYWPQVSNRDYPWFRRLFQDPDFMQRYVDRWGQLRTNIFAASNLLARVDVIASSLQEAQVRNYHRWRILGQEVWPNWYVGKTYADEIGWLKEFIHDRLAWIDTQFLQPPQILPTNPTRHETRLRTPVGRIYYTLDGSDPRAPGGDISPNAKLYEGPLALPPRTRLLARTHHEERWSSPTAAE